MRKNYIKPFFIVHVLMIEDTISNASSYITGGGTGSQMIHVEDWTDGADHDVDGTNTYVF